MRRPRFVVRSDERWRDIPPTSARFGGGRGGGGAGRCHEAATTITAPPTMWSNARAWRWAGRGGPCHSWNCWSAAQNTNSTTSPRASRHAGSGVTRPAGGARRRRNGIHVGTTPHARRQRSTLTRRGIAATPRRYDQWRQGHLRRHDASRSLARGRTVLGGCVCGRLASESRPPRKARFSC